MIVNPRFWTQVSEHKLGMCDVRQTVLIKYCDHVMRDSMLRGSVWLASLEKYRGFKSLDSGLLSDNQEGEFNCLFERLPDQPFKIGGIEFGGGNRFYGIEPGAFAVSTYVRVFGFVFCSSLGPYDREHHRLMLNGWPGYAGNSDRNFYIAFKAGALLELIGEAALAKHGTHEEVLAPCLYGDREGFVGRNRDAGELDWEVFLLAALSKPKTFQQEREIRIALRFEDRPDLSGIEFMKLDVPNLASSILEVGELRDK